MTVTTPTITVGIVTWKSGVLLKQLLDSIVQNIQEITYDVIVVDNASTDNTVNMLKKEYSWITLIENKTNEGVAPARNRILKRARGKYILILDVDTVVLTKSIKVLVDVMDAHPQAAIGGPKLIYGNGSLQLSCRPFPSPFNTIVEGTFLRDWFPNCKWVKKYTLEDWDHGDMREVDWMYGACLIIRKESLRTIGLFDEKFFYLYEDVDLCFRAKKLGYKVLYIPEATIVHFLERERKGIFHPRIGSHVKSLFRYLIKNRYGLLS